MDVAGSAVSIALALTEIRWVPISECRAVLSELAGVICPDLSAAAISAAGMFTGVREMTVPVAS